MKNKIILKPAEKQLGDFQKGPRKPVMSILALIVAGAIVFGLTLIIIKL